MVGKEARRHDLGAIEARIALPRIQLLLRASSRAPICQPPSTMPASFR
jgi:hypothetical protein